MILPREGSYRVAGDESGPQQNTFEIAGRQASFDNEGSGLFSDSARQ
jgi:hypothetical protein